MPARPDRKFSAFSVGAVAIAVALAHANDAHADPSTTSIEQGYDLGEMENPRSLALGGALNALGVSTPALYMNPANLPLARVYHFEGLAAFSPEARRQSYGGAIADSILNRQRIAGGVAGSWSIMDPDGIHRTWTDVRAVLAYPLGDRFSMGVTGRYLRVSQNAAAGPLGASLASGGTPGAPLFNQVTFDVGANLSLSDNFRVGAVGHNLTNPGTALAPTTFVGGLGFSTKEVALEGDALADFTTWKKTRGRFMVGGELFLGEHFAPRVGYRYDDGMRTHAVSIGFGYIDRSWSVELAGRRDVAGEHPSTMLAISLRYFYDAAGLGPSSEPEML